MIAHKLQQGSPAWHAHRATRRNASQAAAMLGCSSHQTRTELLHETYIGLSPDVGRFTQRLYDSGHDFEALARPLGEEIVGEGLFPVVGTLGMLSASFDGLTMAEDQNWEHKRLNEALRTALPNEGPDSNDAANLPKMYRVQMEQQHIVSGATRTLFTASLWHKDEDLGEYVLDDIRHCWYETDPSLAAEIIAGWAQFEIDLAAYVPPEVSPVVVATAVTALPAVAVNVSGQITVIDNFKAFEVALRDFIEHRLIREPASDQDFADLDLQIKALKGAEAALDAAETQMLSQVEAVDLAKRTKDMLHKLTRDNRLMAEKLLASRKEQIKGEIVAGGIADLRTHIESLNARLGKAYMPAIPADFAGAAKNKRTVDSLRESVNQELTRCKIESNAIADKIQLNLGYLREHAKDHTFLFADAGQIVLKATDDLQTLVKSRIADHQAEVARKEEETRERIRLEEKEKLEREQRNAQEAEDSMIAGIWEQARRIEGSAVGYIQKAIGYFESGPADFANDPRPRVAAAVAEARAEMAAKLEAAKAREHEEARRREEQNAAGSAALQGIDEARREGSMPGPVVDALEGVATDLIADLAVSRASETSKPVANVVPMRAAAAPVPASPPTLKLGQIAERLGFALTGDFLKTLGFEPAARDKSALLFHEADFTHILAALVQHIGQVQARQAA